MTDTCDEEFRSVKLLLESSFESRGVDAFCLAWIKMERQLRKIVANIIFQSSTIRCGDEKELREILLKNKSLSHNTFIGAISGLTTTSVSEIIGVRYRFLKNMIDSSYKIRQKIFHGQQTGDNLSRDSLERHTVAICEWCKLLSNAGDQHFGYDGFRGNTSLFKTNNASLADQVDTALTEIGWKNYAANFRIASRSKRNRGVA